MADDECVSAKLSDEEFWHLLQLMERYAETDMDQWDTWRLDTSYGPVYVRITRELTAGEPEQAYRRRPIPLAERYRTGRPARTSDTGEVGSRAGLARVVREMSADLAGQGAVEWENATLGRFLDALAAYLDDSGRPDDGDEASWAVLARALIAATGYE
jgi:hypothetical protein